MPTCMLIRRLGKTTNNFWKVKLKLGFVPCSLVLVYMKKQQNWSSKTWHICTEIIYNISSRISLKDTHTEKTPSNKTPALPESVNMDTWVVGTSNQVFITGSYTETKFSKK